MSEAEFIALHNNRKTIRAILDSWRSRLVPGTREYLHATQRVADESTKQAVKLYVYLDVALAKRLGNDDPIEKAPNWYRWPAEWFDGSESLAHSKRPSTQTVSARAKGPISEPESKI